MTDTFHGAGTLESLVSLLPLAACDPTNPTGLAAAPGSRARAGVPVFPVPFIYNGNKPSADTGDMTEPPPHRGNSDKYESGISFLWEINLDGSSREQCSHFPALTRD